MNNNLYQFYHVFLSLCRPLSVWNLLEIVCLVFVIKIRLFRIECSLAMLYQPHKMLKDCCCKVQNYARCHHIYDWLQHKMFPMDWTHIKVETNDPDNYEIDRIAWHGKNDNSHWIKLQMRIVFRVHIIGSSQLWSHDPHGPITWPTKFPGCNSGRNEMS